MFKVIPENAQQIQETREALQAVVLINRLKDKMIKSVLPVKNVKECFQAQKILEAMGFKLDDYNEYTMQETWTAGDISVIIELQA